MEGSESSSWKSDAGYIWSMIGSAVGFANILGFSSQAYLNGGGAFLIPFFTALLVLGIPLLQLEGIVGQRYGLPLVSAYGRAIGRRGKVFGWLSILAVLTIGAFYTVLTGISVAYAYFSGINKIPSSTAYFFKTTFLKDSGSLTSFGAFAPVLFIFTILVVLFSWFVISRNIQAGIEKTCSVFLPLLSVLMIVFAVSVCFLPGASNGFKQYLMPDFSKLFDPKLWLTSFGHVFFSLSLGLGIVTGYSRHTEQSTSIPRAMFFVALGDTLISVISGFAIFGCLGYMSHISGVAFSEIVKIDSIFEIGFVVFPTILKTFGPFLSQLVGPVFFFCVFIAGVTGVFSIVESIAGNIEVEFSKDRKTAVTIAMVAMSFTSLFFCMGNGQHIIGALGPMVLGFNMLIGGIAEIIVFIYLSKVISGDSIWNKGKRKTFHYLSLKYLVIFILFIVLYTSIKSEIMSGFGYPELVRWGWFVVALFFSWILAKNAHPKFGLK